MMTITQMLDHIDAKAGAVRARFITDTPGQAATYIMKQAQAEQYIAAGCPPDAAPMLVQAEATAVGESPAAAAHRIMAEYRAWADLAAQIESVRRQSKVAVIAATTPEAAQAAFDMAIDIFAGYL